MNAGHTWEQEKRLLKTAEGALGLFTMADWEAAGLTRDQLKVRRRKGTVHRIFNGVFSIAAAPRTHEFRIRAGVLRAGPLAAGNGATAAAKHGLMEPVTPVHIATTRSIHNVNEAYRFHRVALGPSDVVVVDGAPITDISRTLLDACGNLHPKRAMTLYRRAKRLALITDEQAARKIDEEARQGRAGIALMRALATEDLGDLSDLYSDLEVRFLEFLRRWGFPEPLRNVTLDVGGPFPWRPDFFWPGPRPLAVDLDHYFTHAEEWERDREKERALEEHGIRVVRITARMMDDESILARRLRAFFE